MQSLSKDMKQLTARIETVLREEQGSGDPHWKTCQRIADEFELWDTDEREFGVFPLWLSYVVAGIGRESGLLE